MSHTEIIGLQMSDT